MGREFMAYLAENGPLKLSRNNGQIEIEEAGGVTALAGQRGSGWAPPAWTEPAGLRTTESGYAVLLAPVGMAAGTWSEAHFDITGAFAGLKVLGGQAGLGGLEQVYGADLTGDGLVQTGPAALAAESAPGGSAMAEAGTELIVRFTAAATPADIASAVAAVDGRLLEVLPDETGPYGDAGTLATLMLPSGADADAALATLAALAPVTLAERNWEIAVDATSNDPNFTGGLMWGLYGDETTPSGSHGSQAADAWDAGYIGTTDTVVGVIDTGIDPTHEDLYLNIWLNQEEIPAAISGVLVDTDWDNIITFRDLNAPENAAHVTDLNANGRIDARDLLADPAWADGADTDANGYVDDFYGWDFYSNDNDPFDEHNHGTHVAGTIGGIGGNWTGVVGVNWNVQMMALRFLGPSGSGPTSGAISSETYFAAKSLSATGQHFVATNNSWGGGGFSQSLLNAIGFAADQDILFIAAAGNNSTDTDASSYYPSNYDTTSVSGYDAVISVASTTSSGAMSSFSNFGLTTVDLGAPGSSIRSTITDDRYANFSGTSMAAPHVAGAAALYAAADPAATAAQIKTALLGTATPVAALAGKTVTGARLNVDALMDGLGGVGLPPQQTVTITGGGDDIGPIQGDILNGGETDDPSPDLLGALSSGLALDETLLIFQDGVFAGQATAAGTAWNFAAGPLAQGPFTFTAQVVDEQGRLGPQSSGFSLMVDTQAPIVTVDPLTTQDTTPTLTGTVDDPSAAIDVTIGAGTHAATNSPGGDWTLDWPTVLAPGTYNVTATGTDVAGNAGQDATAGELEIEPTADLALQLGVQDNTAFGNRWMGLTDADGLITVSFTEQAQDLSLAVTGYDIDTADEIEIGLNGAPYGFLAPGADNGLSLHEIVIDAGDQLAGENLITFQQKNPAYIWGLADFLIDIAPPPPDVPLALDAMDGGSYGNRWMGLTDADGLLTVGFAGSLEPIKLSLTGYDIDTADEIEVLLNGVSTGFLGAGVDNGTSPHEVFFLPEDQAPGTNIVTLVQKNPGWIWGVTDLLVEEAAPPPDVALTIGVEDPGAYGNRWMGLTDADGLLTAGFQGGTDTLELSLTGYDIDSADEIEIFLNDQPLAFLDAGVNNGTSAHTVAVPLAAQVPGDNVLTFEQANPAWIWGLTDLELNVV